MEEPPFLQRLMDRPFVLLAIGMFVMIAFYTGWGMVELMVLPKAELP